ncbi:lipopolysaccharide biosynthesis protein [Pseudoalteromonas luteoviolacea]|uniref:Polysaccharide biosynthesis protein C-terminal domain-containing protein n=1 Tax=Pseudoalteromonas luteoviolacea DSM 6061 TaxID=1365250 RepID=A0A166XL74_9GAMM|nr:oligosaccharide flippase family protein [Pseudoalteromonas luteoviolacea]KZN40504.1 hypothetical protein N475_12045 [Pseudoalteromonas luteoviolacea DSM 6061]KZN59352.1 hypothetical protein N474_06570 [Pseudoalteromonas luteoviolacea CPMOR-2]MBE0387374.1 hypothetical protein [Pseudoalteromonas luteoviolacea DSM 6061]TQF72191.1 oligosaccharide flippase family protein [Pseudoalteromonas luteoviolacea]
MLKFKALFSKALEKGFFHLLFSNFLVQFLGFGLVLFLAAHLTPAEVGNLKLLHSFGAFFIMLACFGFNSSILKFCSEDVSQGEKQAYLVHGLKAVTLISIISFLLFTLICAFYLIPSREEIGYWPYVYGVSILFAAPALLFLCYLQSQKKVKLAATLQGAVRLAFVAVIFVSAIFYGFEGVVIATVACYFIGLIVYFPLLKNEVSNTTQTTRKSEINRYSAFIIVGALITVVSQNIDIYLLGFLGVASDEIGVYSVATLFFLSGTVITGTIQTVITPYFSEKQDNGAWIREKASEYQNKLIFITIPFSFVLAFASYLMVEYYFGEEYRNAVVYSWFLIGKYFIWSCFCVYGAVLFSIGVVKEGIYIALATLIFNVFISVLLFSQYETLGVAISQFITSLMSLLLIRYVFHIKTKGQSVNEIHLQ